MERLLIAFKGRFQLWLYTASHGQLLFRSTKSTDRATQIDILFKNVSALSTICFLDDVEVIETDMSPIDVARNSDNNMKFFILRSGSYRGFITAGNVLWDEGNHDYADPSPLIAPVGLHVKP